MPSPQGLNIPLSPDGIPSQQSVIQRRDILDRSLNLRTQRVLGLRKAFERLSIAAVVAGLGRHTIAQGLKSSAVEFKFEVEIFAALGMGRARERGVDVEFVPDEEVWHIDVDDTADGVGFLD